VRLIRCFSCPPAASFPKEKVVVIENLNNKEFPTDYTIRDTQLLTSAYCGFFFLV